MILVFIWVYYSAQIFLIGAEFTWIYATKFGSMRNLASQPAVKTVQEIPNADAPPPAPPAIAPAVPAAADKPPAGVVKPAVAGFGLGVAAGVAASFALPKLTRRG